jgi:hypothetical protein
MANTLLTIDMITRSALSLWQNTNSFIRHLDTQYDDSFGQSGAKIGASLRIRLPNDYVVRTGAAASVQDTAESSVSMTIATQKGVDLSFSSAERALKLDDYEKRVLAPAVNNLVGSIGADVMTGVESGCASIVAERDGTGAITTPNSGTILSAGAVLDTYSAPSMGRIAIADQWSMSRLVQSMQGLFNPSAKISEQFENAMMYDNVLGFDWDKDQTIVKHTAGTFTAGTVNGAGQSGLTLVTNAITGTLAVGDIITLAGVNSVNRITKQDSGQLAQFVVTAAAANGATSLSIYPAIVPSNAGSPVQYQTVVSAPANSAAISLLTNASQVYRKNVCFVPEAIALVTADLELPKGVHEAHREQYEGVSMRMVTAYDVRSDQFITRMDVLYGYLWIRPEWVVTIADAI